MKKVDAIVVARAGSNRVPGKAMYDLVGKPVLQHVIERVKSCKHVNSVCLATTTLPGDDVLANLAATTNVALFRGDPEKVLDRVYLACRHIGAKYFIEVGGDCPLVDPLVLDEAILSFDENSTDYLNNYNPPTFPEGMDINILSVDALGVAYRDALAPSHRIHPFSYLADNPDIFRVKNYVNKQDLSRFHWSFDFPRDFEFIQAIFNKLYPVNPNFGMQMVLDAIRQDQVIAGLNEKLKTLPVANAFWNSPGVIRDLNEDIAVLARHAQNAITTENYQIAARCYKEIALRTIELQKFIQSKHK